MMKYDAAECERLEREVREDDERLGEWRYDAGSVRLSMRDREGNERDDIWFRHHKDARAVVRTRNNLRAMADQLAAARAEIERLTEDVKAGDERMAAVLDGTFAVGDGTAQKEIERLRRLNSTLARQSREVDTVMADNVEAARAEAVEAAEEWRFDPDVPSPNMPSENALEQAVDAYRAARDKAGR